MAPAALCIPSCESVRQSGKRVFKVYIHSALNDRLLLLLPLSLVDLVIVVLVNDCQWSECWGPQRMKKKLKENAGGGGRDKG